MLATKNERSVLESSSEGYLSIIEKTFFPFEIEQKKSIWNGIFFSNFNDFSFTIQVNSEKELVFHRYDYLWPFSVHRVINRVQKT